MRHTSILAMYAAFIHAISLRDIASDKLDAAFYATFITGMYKDEHSTQASRKLAQDLIDPRTRNRCRL